VNHAARTRASLALALVLATLAVLFNPTSSGDRLRSMLGLGQDLTFTITDLAPGDGFAFAMTQPVGGGPVRWNPCRAIRYVVNPDGAAAGGEAIVAAAVDDIAQASGLDFRFDGTTDDRTFEDRAGVVGSAPPVLVAWATPDEVADLAGDVAGVGGSEAVSSGTDQLTYVTGMVALDRDAFAGLAARPNGADVQRAVVEHELAHVVGLDHVDDPGQLMYAETTDRTRLGAGDLRGLAVLGDGPCR
jgi:hypothetical protein